MFSFSYQPNNSFENHLDLLEACFKIFWGESGINIALRLVRPTVKVCPFYVSPKFFAYLKKTHYSGWSEFENHFI